jgi:hydroxymethylbilane synthase
MAALTLVAAGGRLAQAQAEQVAAALRVAWADIAVRIEAVGDPKSGDGARPVMPSGPGGPISAVRAAVLSGRADVAVHAYEVVPYAPAPGLRIAAVPPRGDPRDALVSRSNRTFPYLPQGARLSASGEWREAQLLRRRGDLAVMLSAIGVEGHLAVLDAGGCDGVVVATVDLQRLGLAERITERIDTDLLIPAPGQGALALEIRDGDTSTADLLAPVHDEYTAYAVRAERTCAARLGSDGDAPIAVHAATDGGLMSIHGIVATADGAHAARLRWSGPWREADEVGATLAELLLAAGARQILAGQPLESTGRYTFRVAGTGRRADEDDPEWGDVDQTS